MTQPIRMHITLSYHQREMLKLLSERGGETPYRFGVIDADVTGETAEARDKSRKNKEGADDSIRQMATLALGPVITITPIVAPLDGRADLLKLTEVGRRVTEMMMEQKI